MNANAGAPAIDRAKVTADNIGFVRRFATRLSRSILRRFGGIDEAAAALMPYYIQAVDAWLKRARTGDQDDVGAYIFIALKRSIAKAMHDEFSLIRVPEDHRDHIRFAFVEIPSFAPPIARDAEETLPHRSELFRIVRDAIGGLSRIEQETITARYSRDPEPYKRIGERVGRHEETIRSAEKRALDRLRPVLAGCIERTASKEF